jgi:hypothetical protein
LYGRLRSTKNPRASAPRYAWNKKRTSASTPPYFFSQVQSSPYFSALSLTISVSFRRKKTAPYSSKKISMSFPSKQKKKWEGSCKAIQKKVVLHQKHFKMCSSNVHLITYHEVEHAASAQHDARDLDEFWVDAPPPSLMPRAEIQFRLSPLCTDTAQCPSHRV